MNFKKKHLYFLVITIFMIGILVFVKASTLNQNLPWHPLQQVSTDSTGATSVDENNNGIPDNADHATIADNANGIKGNQLYWNSTGSLCYNTGGSSSCGTQVQATCPAGSTGLTILLLTGKGDSNPSASGQCSNACKTQLATYPANGGFDYCDGNTGACPGTVVYWNGGVAAPTTDAPCSSPGGKCECTCTLSAATPYNLGSPGSSTTKCAVFK